MWKEENQRKVQEIKDTSKSLGDKGKFNEKRQKTERNEAKMMSAEKCWNASSGNKNPADKRRLKKGLMSEGQLSVCDESLHLITHTINQAALNHPQTCWRRISETQTQTRRKTEPRGPSDGSWAWEAPQQVT